MRAFRCGVVMLFAATALAFAADVVVLKGGARIELKKPPVRQGTVVMLTRADGTLLSVADSEIDWKATAAARAAAPASAAPAPVVTAPPETPAEAARSGRARAKARIKLTDADVAHVDEAETASDDKEKKESEPGSGAARLEIADYTQEKSATDLVVRGSLRNAGGVPASSARMTVTAMDDKGEKIASGEAVIANGSIEPGATASFSAKIPVGGKSASSIRFAPHWLEPAPQAPVPSPTPGPALPAGGKAASSGQKPEGRPTPYGQGTLFAAPAPQASTSPPPDGSPYLPGMASPENQPKPPQ